MKTERHSAFLPLVPWLMCLAGMLAQFRFMIFSGFAQTQDQLLDGRLVNFTLEHGYRWIRQIPPHENFWQPPIFYPYPNASAFTDVMLGFGPTFWLARLLGAEPDTALQWWMLSVYGLNFAATYLMLRKGVKLAIPASSVGALLLALISVAWSTKLQLYPFFYMMLALLALFRIFDQSEGAPGTAARRTWIGVLSSCGILQLWSAVYAFFFFGLLTAIAAVVALARLSTRRVLIQGIRRDTGVWILFLALSVTAATPLLLHYGMTVEEVGYRNYKIENVVHPYSWIAIGPQDPIFGRLIEPGGPLQRYPTSIGIGLLTFCVAAAGLFASRRRKSVQIMAAATLTMMLLGSAYGELSPWRLVYEFVPGAGAIRAQYRVTMTLIPAAVIGVALAFNFAWRRRHWWLGLLLVCVVVTERFQTKSTIDKEFVRDHVAAIAERVDPNYKAFFLVGFDPKGRFVGMDATWVALATGTPTINGRYGNYPKNYNYRERDRFDKSDVESLEKLEITLQEWLDLWGIDRSDVQWIEYEPLNFEAMQAHRLP